MTVSEVVAKLSGMVTLPEVFHRVRELLDDPQHDTESVARIVERDTNIAARVLAVANSSLYGRSGRIDRIRLAIQVIGANALNDLILATTVARSFARISAKHIDVSSFWHHSIHCGLVARNLSERCALLHGERMLLAGMLHDIGQLVLFQVAPQEAAQALATASATDDGMRQAELAVFGFAHTDVGAELAKQWRLPASLQEIIRWHHTPALATAFPLEAAIVHLANSAANQVEPARNVAALVAEIEPAAYAITGLDKADQDAALEASNAQFAETLGLLIPNGAIL